MYLTNNFTLSELIKSQTALRLDIDNNPSDQVLGNLTDLCVNVLQPVRDYYKTGVTINSGYRSPELNKAIGGVPTSDHCMGYAADIEIPGIPNYDIARYIADTLNFTQLILEFYTPGIPDSGWVHVSYNPSNLKNQILTAVKANGKTVYKSGLIS